MTGKRFTPDDLLFIRENYATMPTLAIAKRFGKSVHAIYVHASTSGLKKTKTALTCSDLEACACMTLKKAGLNDFLAAELAEDLVNAMIGQYGGKVVVFPIVAGGVHESA